MQPLAMQLKWCLQRLQSRRGRLKLAPVTAAHPTLGGGGTTRTCGDVSELAWPDICGAPSQLAVCATRAVKCLRCIVLYVLRASTSSAAPVAAALAGTFVW